MRVSAAQAAGAIAAEMDYYRSRMAQGTDTARVAALRADCAEVLRGALPPAPPLRALDGATMTELLLDALRFKLFPEVPAVLALAREHGVRVVVASNWDALLPDVLGALGITSLLHGIVTSAQAGAPKPAAPVFRAALALAGVEAHEALHVGDSVEDDVIGARAAGIEPILVRRDGARGPDGVTTISSLRDLAALCGSAPAIREP